MLVSCKIVSWVKEGEGNLLTTCNQLMVDVIPKNKIFQHIDYRLIMELSRKLNSVI